MKSVKNQKSSSYFNIIKNVIFSYQKLIFDVEHGFWELKFFNFFNALSRVCAACKKKSIPSVNLLSVGLFISPSGKVKCFTCRHPITNCPHGTFISRCTSRPKKISSQTLENMRYDRKAAHRVPKWIWIKDYQILDIWDSRVPNNHKWKSPHARNCLHKFWSSRAGIEPGTLGLEV